MRFQELFIATSSSFIVVAGRSKGSCQEIPLIHRHFEVGYEFSLEQKLGFRNFFVRKQHLAMFICFYPFPPSLCCHIAVQRVSRNLARHNEIAKSPRPYFVAGGGIHGIGLGDRAGSSRVFLGFRFSMIGPFICLSLII